MIEELHGRRETVLHPATQAFRLYMNIEAENYPAHWHTDLEIIMPIENIYTAVIEKQSYCLEPTTQGTQAYFSGRSCNFKRSQWLRLHL